MIVVGQEGEGSTLGCQSSFIPASAKCAQCCKAITLTLAHIYRYNPVLFC